jgi:hypothetical protein
MYVSCIYHVCVMYVSCTYHVCVMYVSRMCHVAGQPEWPAGGTRRPPPLRHRDCACEELDLSPTHWHAIMF